MTSPADAVNDAPDEATEEVHVPVAVDTSEVAVGDSLLVVPFTKYYYYILYLVYIYLRCTLSYWKTLGIPLYLLSLSLDILFYFILCLY